MLRWSKWVKVGVNPGKVVLRWSKWVKVGLNPGTVVLRWSKWVKVGVNPGKVVLRECKRVKGGLNPDTGVLRWSKRVKGSLIWFKCGSKLIHTDPEYPCKTKYLPPRFLPQRIAGSGYEIVCSFVFFDPSPEFAILIIVKFKQYYQAWFPYDAD